MSVLKRAFIGVLISLLVVCVGLFFWARTVLATETVRTAIASQISKFLGQPVTIGQIDATIYPRLTVNLENVGIGQPAKIHVQRLQIGTDLRALLSRRIEHARMNFARARIELPLPDFAVGSTSTPTPAGDAASSSPLEIVSIDQVTFSDVEIVSGGRTLHGDVEVVPRGTGVVVRKVALTADNATIDITGAIEDLAGPTGELTIRAGELNIDQLMTFVSDFSAGSGVSAISGGASAPVAAPGKAVSSSRATMDLWISIEADRATMGTLTLHKLTGRAHATPDGVTLEPTSFGAFAGRIDGSLALSLGAVRDFHLAGTLSNIDVTAVTAFVGSPNTISGKLAGRIDLIGRGMDPQSVMKTARGTTTIEITNGTIKNLGLIQSVIVATSGRADAEVSATDASKDEPFTRLGGTMTIADGSASTQNLKMESNDVLLDASGAVRLDGTLINLAGQVQLSGELSQRAGRDLVRYTQDSQGRVTLPATIGGSADNPQVRINVASLAKRAVANKAKEEAQRALQRGLGRLFKKK
jgi:uncharacterized protein involved in outer membrane biogenesis